jgi:hypothetical protein
MVSLAAVNVGETFAAGNTNFDGTVRVWGVVRVTATPAGGGGGGASGGATNVTLKKRSGICKTAGDEPAQINRKTTPAWMAMLAKVLGTVLVFPIAVAPWFPKSSVTPNYKQMNCQMRVDGKNRLPC